MNQKSIGGNRNNDTCLGKNFITHHGNPYQGHKWATSLQNTGKMAVWVWE